MGDTEETADAQPAERAVKFVDGSDDLIRGLAIPFGGPNSGKDLTGEAFGPDTDFSLDWYPQGRPLIYQHGLDGAMKTFTQGRQTTHEIDDEGVWATAQLDKSAKYHAKVKELIVAGKLFFSSGSIWHLAKATKSGHITNWPWVELSLTPTPANPLATVQAVKTVDLIERLHEADLPVPAQLIALAIKALDAQNAEPEALVVPEPVDLSFLHDTAAALARAGVATTEGV